MADVIEFGLYNTKDYGRNPDTKEGYKHDRQVEEVIHSLNLGPLSAMAVLELPGHDLQRAANTLRQLAAATDMQCMVRPQHGNQPAIYAVAPSIDPATHNRLCVGLMWGNSVQPVADTWRRVSVSDYDTVAGLLTLDFDGVRIDCGAYHAPSLSGRGGDRQFVNAQRIVGAQRLVRATTGPMANPLTILGLDANSLSAVIVDNGTGPAFYDPDPYTHDSKHESGARADRRPSEVFMKGGFVDVAPFFNPGAHEPTTGHWPTEQNGDRRTDVLLTAKTLAQGLVVWPEYPRGYQVYNTPLARKTSDHLPVVARFWKSLLTWLS